MIGHEVNLRWTADLKHKEHNSVQKAAEAGIGSGGQSRQGGGKGGKGSNRARRSGTGQRAEGSAGQAGAGQSRQAESRARQAGGGAEKRAGGAAQGREGAAQMYGELSQQQIWSLRFVFVVGFFRIWELPDHAATGLMGKFRPSIPLSQEQACNREEMVTKEEVDNFLRTECRAHYSQAEVDRRTYELNDYVTINSDSGLDYTGKILEFFETADKTCWLSVQWMFRPEDTVLGQEEAKKHDKKRLFYSNENDVIPLECITSKIKVLQLPPLFSGKQNTTARCHFYYDMGYRYDYSTFYTINSAMGTEAASSSDSASTVCNTNSFCNQRLTRSRKYDCFSDSVLTVCTELSQELIKPNKSRRVTRSCKYASSRDSVSTVCTELVGNRRITRAHKLKQSNVADSMQNASSNTDLSLLDMYSGCGGMSTGLCMGASLSGIKLVMRWAVDLNVHACESFKLNHLDTEVRNEAAEDFLSLIKEWEKLCNKYSDDQIFNSSAESKFEVNGEKFGEYNNLPSVEIQDNYERDGDSISLEDGEYEVEKITGIRWLDPIRRRKSGLEFKVHWRGYPNEEDSWEPLDAIKGCEERLRDFVAAGRKRKLLPLPGEVDVICGGPPCQGITGLNRFRNANAPLEDPKNEQIVVFMDIVEFLKPRFVFLENVVDILRFSGGFLGRYAISRLVQMHYQAKFGLMAAGCYGLPQFRMRFFLLGASPSETLPAFPLPTHDVLVKGRKPSEWERNVVAYNDNYLPQLNEAILLKDAISDLPPVKNTEKREQVRHTKAPLTEFQKFIRLPKETNAVLKAQGLVQDHRPLVLNRDDFERMRRIPKKKGANFRDLPGVRRLSNGTVQLDAKKSVKLSSGKQLVPDYALNYSQGRSSRPFGRIWWDEIVSTVMTRTVPHTQSIIHPAQDRVLTIRECARLQGFPDHYKFSGPIKERYRQLGNAVAIPVGKALGYTLGLAVQQLHVDKSEVELPLDFPFRSASGSSRMRSMQATTFHKPNLRPRKLQHL